MAHTEGPWRIGNLPSYDGYTGEAYRNVWAGEPPLCIARAIAYGDVDANAALIAAAPDLLAACQAVAKAAAISSTEERFGENVSDGFEALQAAIRKATGRAP